MCLRDFLRDRRVKIARPLTLVLLFWAASPASTGLVSQAESSPEQTEPSSGGQRKEVVQISIHPEGFSPAELEQKTGRFLLSIIDRTGLPETDVAISRQGGNRLLQVRIPAQAARWADLLDLPPGRYVLTEASHPDWQCLITITPR